MLELDGGDKSRIHDFLFCLVVNTLVSFVATPCFPLGALLRLPLVHRPASPPQAFYTRPGQLLGGSLEETEE